VAQEGVRPLIRPVTRARVPGFVWSLPVYGFLIFFIVFGVREDPGRREKRARKNQGC